jgi:DNA adenine methylase
MSKHTGMVAEDQSVRPPLKWLGGKRWQVPHLRALWAPHTQRRLVEPFCGGLAVSLGLMPNEALVNDVNEHLVNFYRWLKKGLVVSIPMKNRESLYYQHRKRFNVLTLTQQSKTAESASLFYYLNRTGYNGLCRFNRKGQFNVPFGTYKHINYSTDFREYRPLFRKWRFACGDFSRLPITPDDFIYADPPYDVEFTQYSSSGFSWDDQVRTAEWLASHPAPVVLANQATPRIVTLYRRLGFRLRYLDAPRRISCTGNRTPAREVIATRNL